MEQMNMGVEWGADRPEFSAQIRDALQTQYGLLAQGEVTDLGGAFTLNVLLESPTGRYVARVHPSHTSAARLADIQFVRRHLDAGGVPSTEPVRATDGAPFVAVDGELLEVERYVEHDANMNTWDRLETGLVYLGRVHSLLQSVEVSAAGSHPRLANHIHPEHALAGAMHGVRRMRAWHPTEEERSRAAAYEELAHLVHNAEHSRVTSLPRQLVHGDFWDNNVLFGNGEVVLVADLDFMGKRLRIDDLALTLYFANSSIGQDRRSETRIRQLSRLVDAYDHGLDDRLSREERQALPAAIARQTLWTIGRWVVASPDTETARALAAGRAVDLEWTLDIMRDLARWQDAFAPCP
jgi:Ser/Thr protein kinase RdoA (MazF antagonist)